MYSWVFFPAHKEQHKLAYSSDEGDKVYKCIGHLRADFGQSGREFWTSWWEHGNAELKTREFMDAFDEAINTLRRKDGEINPLFNRRAMERCCWSDYPEARESEDGNNYIFRMDVFPDSYPKTHSVYTLIMRMNPGVGMYNLYCYCYHNGILEGGEAWREIIKAQTTQTN